MSPERSVTYVSERTKDLYRLHAVSHAVECKAHDFVVCFAHVRRHSVPVDVHGCADVRMTHEPLLHSHRCTDRIKPRAVCVPECVAAKVTEDSGIGGSLQFLFHARVRVGQFAMLKG